VIPTFRHPVVLRGNKWALLFSLQLQKLLQIKIFILVWSLHSIVEKQNNRTHNLMKQHTFDKKDKDFIS